MTRLSKWYRRSEIRDTLRIAHPLPNSKENPVLRHDTLMSLIDYSAGCESSVFIMADFIGTFIVTVFPSYSFTRVAVSSVSIVINGGASEL